MRLQELYHTIVEKVNEFPESIFYPYSHTVEEQGFVFENMRSIYKYLLSLNELPGLQNLASTFLKIIDQDKMPMPRRISITEEKRTAVQYYLDGVRLSIMSIKVTLEEVGISEREYGFDIKLPPNATLQDLCVLVKNLDFVFSQCPLFRKDDGQITYSGVDVGSAWLTFTVVGAGAIYILNKLAEFVDKCIIIRSHWLTCKQQEESLRRLKLSNDILNELENKNQAILEKAKEQVISELAASDGIVDPEDNERLKYALNVFIEHMNKGMEIYACVGAPQEIKAIFPAVETQALPDTALKMLTASDDSE